MAPSRRRSSLLAATAAAAAATALASSGSTVLAYSGASSGSYSSSGGCPFARLAAFSTKVSTPAGRRSLLAEEGSGHRNLFFSENPYLQPAKIFMKMGHQATADYAQSLTSPVPGPIEQAATGLSEPSERDHSHGLTDAFVDAYLSAAMAAHGLDFARMAAEDPVMSQRPGVKRMLLLAKKEKGMEKMSVVGEEEEETDEEAAAADDDEEFSSSSSTASLKEAAEELLADKVRVSVFVSFCSDGKEVLYRQRKGRGKRASQEKKKSSLFFLFNPLPFMKKKPDSQETTERATKEFQRAHRRALAGFLLPTTPPFSNYSASLGNSSTGVTGEELEGDEREEAKEKRRRREGNEKKTHALFS
jgi:hypothetical protein